jgi:hypothetical protein
MSNQWSSLGTTPVRLSLMPLCVFNFLSALSVSFRFRFEHSARAALPGAGFLLAGECFARFLLAADASH